MKKAVIFLAILFLLVLADQSAKVLIDNYTEFNSQDLSQVKDTVHIHPLLNNQTQNKIISLSEKTGLSVALLKLINVLCHTGFNAIVFAALLFLNATLKIANTKTHPLLFRFILMLLCVVPICRLCDEIFRGGTLDFICISRAIVNHHGKHQILHASFDLCDCYLFIFVLSLIVYAILFAKNFSAATKYKDAKLIFKTVFHNFFENIKQGVF